MKMLSLLSVEEIRGLPVFRSDCEKIADAAAFSRTLAWAMVLDPQKEEYPAVGGGEFYFVQSDRFDKRHTDTALVKDLISGNASGLCIMNTTVYHRLSEEAEQLAKEHHFPIFLTEQNLDITETIRTINKAVLESGGSENELILSEEYSRRLLEKENESNTELLRYTADVLHCECIYWHILSEPVTTGQSDLKDRIKEDREDILALKDNEIWRKENIAACSIHVLSEPYADVFLLRDSGITDFDITILKKLTSVLRRRVISDFLNRLQLQHSRDTQWVRFWIEGKLSDRLIRDHVDKLKIGKPEAYIVGSVKLPRQRSYSYNYRRSHENDNRIVSDAILQTSILMFRSFRAEGFSSYQHIDNTSSRMWHIYLAPEGMKDWKERYQKAVETLNGNEEFLKDDPELRLGLSSCTKKGELPLAAANAEYTRDLRLSLPQRAVTYESLHLLKAVEALRASERLDSFIDEELGDLLLEENEELLKTLRCYFQCNCRKNKTADALYIVRQTLYARLERIEEILGKGFDQDGRRVALEIAIAALELGGGEI
ncbi:MAG: helix-turn-helix domain-containing protein [Erysipelotrichaceae bacterium]|nr:helix-turn-helix domain-containing protein [Erysipelotrichaceae bacterium]